MKKYTIFLLLAFAFSPIMLVAQDEDKEKQAVERPKNCGVSDFDTFKNSSFDVMEESATLKASITQLDNEIKNYSGVMNTLSVDKLKTNLKALMDSKGAVKTITENIAGLSKEGAELLKNAKGLKPKTKSVSATKNTNKSIKGLDLAKNDLAAVGELLVADIKIISDELKSRGEPIE